VLTHAAGRGATHTLCLGDIVGYHALPHETIARLRDRQVLSVAGNHDLAVLGALSDAHATPLARDAVAWTRDVLDQNDLDYLRRLPTQLCQFRRLLCVHAALDDTERRLVRDDDFRAAAATIRERYPMVDVCLTGHTHRQELVAVDPDGIVTSDYPPDGRLVPGAITFINPGSVGRQLNVDPRAAYATLDWTTGAVGFWRVAYDEMAIEAADRRAGLLRHARDTSAGLRQWLGAFARSLHQQSVA
jgi:predicted phosphodiesterase